MEEVQVSEIMTRRPVTVNVSVPVDKAAGIMKRYRIGSILVMDKKKLVGILTVEDIAYSVTAKALDASKVLVDDIMTRGIIFIKPDASLRDAMEVINDNDIKQLPVISDDKLVGLVTMKDLLRIGPAVSDLIVEHVRFSEETRQKEIKRLEEEPYIDDDDFD